MLITSPALLSDPFLFGRVATLHCFSDIFAMGAEPHSALVLALLPFSENRIAEERLYQMLSGVTHELRSMPASLLGGHTAEGSQLGLGLTVNGAVDKDRVLRKRGIHAGDKLILIKPLGTGVLFAADMRLKAKGRWIDKAIESMLVSNQVGGQIFAKFQAHACTDVTGFGLVGHLLEMLAHTTYGARLVLAALPTLDGALECFVSGIRSSLHSENQISEAAIHNLRQINHEQCFPLLFDPQTSGGLLGAVAANGASNCLAALQQAGYHEASIIGEVVDRESSKLMIDLA